MKDVLVVEDDKLVRMGIISAVPWHDYGMRIVGEAKNGAKAMEFLETRQVDLILTDLAMPVMSGIELMREVRVRYPDILFIVLTMHQDFEYIQEALRLGAIDYIAKVELEKDKFETILARIVKRMEERTAGFKQERKPDAPERLTAGEIFACVRLDRSEKTAPMPESVANLAAELGIDALEAGPGLWLWIPQPEASMAQQLKERLSGMSGFALIRLHGLAEMHLEEAKRRLRDYVENDFFYDYVPLQPVSIVDLRQSEREAGDDDNLSQLRNEWLSREWIYSFPLFQRLIGELKAMRLPQPRLLGLLYSLSDEWNRRFSAVEGAVIEAPERLDYWYQAEEWLAHIRDAAIRSVDRHTYSEEVTLCVMKAVAILHEELDRPITAGETARRVNMSRSYFSQCFRDVTGRTFNDYVRHIRIDKARELLLYSNKTVQWIAEHTGYRDEKYFSRLFREETGMLPSEYRQSGRKGENCSPKG
ncbi:helix-turn-helix domain-containing protein [Paenibacillus humicola]|uniref:helix-turn-helix domain-containing protein n=1 Tax=Paenibacillus humicola TaxID=3110540 RepID=UPI00237B94C0|nr:response regulator [Paenibacillus humicola]